MKEKDPYPVPVLVNLLLIAGCFSLFAFFLYKGSHSDSIWKTALYGIAFGVTLLPVYSLIHEAEHNILHKSQAANLWLGRVLCCMFIVSFSFIRHCHFKHHKKNRTDSEMWDLYYEHQSKIARFGNLYLMMAGFGYLAIWLSVILFTLWPRLVYSRFFSRHREIAGFLEGSNTERNLSIYRLECICVILFQAGLFYLLGLNLLCWLIMYLLHGFIWSSQNYVNHAFSPREIMNGAHNLRVPFFGKLIYLNFNLHKAHHQNPHIPWIHLAKFARKDPPAMSFFRNYLRLWGGPKLTRIPEPRALKKMSVAAGTGFSSSPEEQ